MQRSLGALLWCIALPGAAPDSIIANAPAQSEALELLTAPGAAPREEDVLLALDRGWFEAAKRGLALMRSRGDSVASLTEVRNSATRIRDQATEVINLMRTGANAEETVVTTAFQWAQRPEFVYLNVKFSSRIDGPVTCLNVDNERIEFGNDTMLFEGTGRQKPKLFRLNLTFFGAILPEQSSWSFGSVGRISITIAKASNETWPRLLQSKQKPKNMHTWYERQTMLDEEVKKEKAARKKEKEAATATAKEDAAKGASPPPAPGEAPPTPGESATSASSADGANADTKKPKTKKKKSKKEAAPTKDEV